MTEKPPVKQSESNLEDLLGDSGLMDSSDLNQADASTEELGKSVKFLHEMPANDGNVLSGSEILEEVSGSQLEGSRGGGLLKWLIILTLLGGIGGAGWWYRDLVLAQVQPYLIYVPWLPIKLPSGAQPAKPPVTATRPAAEPSMTVLTPTPSPSQVNRAPEQVQPVPAPVAVVTPPAPKLPPARRLESIKLISQNAQSSVYEITLDGAVQVDPKLFSTPDPPPRLVLDIAGIQKGLGKSSMKTGDRLVKQVRLGLHPSPPKLRLVFDLSAKGLKGELKNEQNKLQVTISH